MPHIRLFIAVLLLALFSCSAWGQLRQNQHFPYPIQPWSVTPPSIPDPVPGGEINDYQSMSPDSWSAPTTLNSLPATPQASGSNDFQTTDSPSTDSSNDFRIPNLAGDSTDLAEIPPASSSAPKANQVGPLAGTPSIPNLKSQLKPSTLSNRSTQPVADTPSIQDSIEASPGFAPSKSGFPNLQCPTGDTVQGTIVQPPHSIITQPAPVNSSVTTELYPPAFQQPLPAPPQFPGSSFGYQANGATPVYRPDLGHRSPMPTVRNGHLLDSTEKFDFEDKKKQYPPMSEILATGRYFGSITTLYLQPSFQTNTALTTVSPGLGTSFPFDFDYEVAPQLEFGFESKYGPGIRMNYWQYDESSNPSRFQSDGITTGESSTWMMGPYRWSRLIADDPGERLEAVHSLDVETFQVMFFKEIQFPISRLNGGFGLQYASIAQTLESSLLQGSTTLGSLSSSSDMRAYGPRLMFEYFRPIGHTKFEFLTSFGGSVLFGERDQFVSNTVTGDFSRVGADEFLLTSAFSAGVQYNKRFAEKRSVYGRFGFISQAWLGGGTAVNAQDDFGLRGFSFSVGYNR